MDIEPTSAKGVTKIGKDKYGSAQEAEADVKRLCGGAATIPKTKADCEKAGGMWDAATDKCTGAEKK